MKLLLAIAAALIFIALTINSLPYLQSGQLVVSAADNYQFTTRRPVWRFLDTDGDGTGTINATGNYTTATAFYIEPPAAAIYVLESLTVSIQDTTVITSGYYGDITLTNGIAIRRVSGSEVITLTDSIYISDGQDWSKFCEVQETAYTTAGGNVLQATCNLGGIQLNGDRDETLEVILEDDFSGLGSQHFLAQGYQQ